MKRLLNWLIRLALRLGQAAYDAEVDPVKKHRLAKDIWEFKKDMKHK